MHKLIEYICDEIDDLEAKASKDHKLSAAEVQYLDTLAHTKKNLLTAEAMEDADGYSEMYDGRSYDGRMTGGRMYRGSSYARGRGRTARRDSMGRYSRMDGYSGDDDIDQLKEIMNETENDQLREEIKRVIKKAEMM